MSDAKPFSKSLCCSLAASLSLISFLPGDGSLRAEENADAKPSRFLRLAKDEAQQLQSLQTAITRYRARAGQESPTVDLIAAVHIGDRGYFHELNTIFAGYDAVLYELVAPKRAIPNARSHSRNPLSLLQKSAEVMLGLESQLELVDYRKSNFVHADMTPEQITRKMQTRGDTPLTLALSTFVDVLRQQNRAPQRVPPEESEAVDSGTEDLFKQLDDPVKLRRMLATQFVQPDALEAGLGPTLNRMLISDRNRVAIQVLKKQLAQGVKRVAIFYGAAHMPDFEKRLKKEFGMQKTDQRWITAWDLTESSARRTSEDPLSVMLKLLRELD